MKRSKGVIQLIPLIMVAALAAVVIVGTGSINKITSFFNKAAENLAISSPSQFSPGPTSSPASQADWQACISTPGAKILQTYPTICVYPDGRRVVEPITNTEQCGGIRGIICPAGQECVYSDGTTTAPYPDASGTCQTKAVKVTATTSSAEPLSNTAPGSLPLTDLIPTQPNTTSVTATGVPVPRTQVACPMDAKLCPDGSYVGRTGPNCQFTCPNQPGPTLTPPTPKPTCVPMPPCVISNPRCLLPEPAEGWCPATPFPSPTGAITSPLTPLPTPPPSFLDNIFNVINKIIAVPGGFIQLILGK